jgi:hypothetical protein
VAQDTEYTRRMAGEARVRTDERDYYAVLGAQPSASATELRGAFRDAVLRHHPDRAPSSEVATRRTSLLNRAWAELRDPLRRLHYDRSLERGNAATVHWPLEEGETPSTPRLRRRRLEPLEPSPWHQPQWRSVAGFRVPAEVFLAGPAVQRRWIVDHHIRGEDWREHGERYWLRLAAVVYREQGRTEDALGVLERLVDLEPNFEGIVQANLRDAFAEGGQGLRGAAPSINLTSGPRNVAGRSASNGRSWASSASGGWPAAVRPSAPRTGSCC